jgi:hypothetical protein
MLANATRSKLGSGVQKGYLYGNKGTSRGKSPQRT